MDDPKDKPEETPALDDGQWLAELTAMQEQAQEAREVTEPPPAPEPDPAFEQGWELRQDRQQNLERQAPKAAEAVEAEGLVAAGQPFAQPELAQRAHAPAEQQIDAQFADAVGQVRQQAELAQEQPAAALPLPELPQRDVLPVEQGLEEAFADAVGQMQQQAEMADELPPAADLTAEVPQQPEFVRPERQPGEKYVQYSKRVQAAKREHVQRKAEPRAEAPFAIRPPQNNPHEQVVQQRGNLNQPIPIAMPAAEIERLTREGADTAANLGARFKVYIEQQRAITTTLIALLDAATAQIAQQQATLEHIRARFERTREA